MKKINFIKTDLAGNTTAFISTKIGRNKQPAIAQELMKPECLCAEQVGFVENPCNQKANARLQMMGGEICLNATLSLASILLEKEKSVCLELSGFPDLVRCKRAGSQTMICLKLKPEIKTKILKLSSRVCRVPFVDLGGIAYFIVKDKEGSNQSRYKNEFNKINKQIGNFPLPQAWGIIFYKKNKIQPIVYVKKTKSLVCERACGSGSLAFSLVKGYRKVIQPSGEIIKISKSKNKLGVSGKVKIIAEGFVYL